MIGTRLKWETPEIADEPPEYWVTYSDLLVSLLVVFALLLFLTLSKMQRDVAGARATVEANQHAVSIAAASMGDMGSSLHFDPKTQTLTMDAQVLFGYASDVLRPEASATINAVATQFLPGLLADSATNQRLQEIVVEGHTDTVGSYMSNLDLSQRRALSVMRALVANEASPYGARIKELITASGRSEVEPRYINGVYDAAQSRRIELRIRFRDNELLKRILHMEQAAGP
jgi:chemotaxis protein MotB